MKHWMLEHHGEDLIEKKSIYKRRKEVVQEDKAIVAEKLKSLFEAWRACILGTVNLRRRWATANVRQDQRCHSPTVLNTSEISSHITKLSRQIT